MGFGQFTPRCIAHRGVSQVERFQCVDHSFFFLFLGSRIREFEGITSLACGDARLVQTDMNTPFAIVNVDARGNMSTFDPELLSVHTERFGDFSFGHVLRENTTMIDMCRDLGFTIASDPEDTTQLLVTLDLSAVQAA